MEYRICQYQDHKGLIEVFNTNSTNPESVTRRVSINQRFEYMKSYVVHLGMVFSYRGYHIGTRVVVGSEVEGGKVFTF